MALRDISCYLFRVSGFLEAGAAYKRASYLAEFILALTSSRVEQEGQSRVGNQSSGAVLGKCQWF